MLLSTIGYIIYFSKNYSGIIGLHICINRNYRLIPVAYWAGLSNRVHAEGYPVACRLHVLLQDKTALEDHIPLQLSVLLQYNNRENR